MSTKYAVLGLLLERRGYGYQLVQRLSERLGPAWRLTPSSVYTALDLLETEGWIRSTRTTPEPAGEESRAPRRVIYEVTAAGCKAFSGWVRRPSTRQEPIRHELHLKVALARPEDAAELLAALRHEEQLARMLSDECLDGVETSGSGKPPWTGTGAALARAGALAKLGGELRWIGVARTALEALAAGRETPGAELLRDL